MFDNWVRRKTFGLNTQEVTGGWIKLRDWVFVICTLCQMLLGVSKRRPIRCVEKVMRFGEKVNTHSLMVGKSG